MNRTFLHVDMDAFFASVEQHDDPSIRGLPVVIGAARDKRGVVAAASYEARKFGIHSAMPSREAARLCPHAVFLPPNGRRYAEVSDQIHAIFERFTPLVEPLSIDEAFLDVTGCRSLLGDGPTIARKIKSGILAETGLTASVGVASNKFLAKLASDMDKPDGLTVVPDSPDEIRKFLAPLPVGRIWGVGKVTREALESCGIKSVGDLQRVPEKQLADVVGRHGAEHLRRLSMGEDDREIELDYEEKSISREYTFPEDCSQRERVRQVLLDLVDDVGSNLREIERFAAVAHLKLRWQGFKTITRQRHMATPVFDDAALREVALQLFDAEDLIKPVRLVGFGVSGLTVQLQEQMSLFNEESESRARQQRLSRAVDAIRAKLGSDSIGRAGHVTDRKKK